MTFSPRPLCFHTRFLKGGGVLKQTIWVEKTKCFQWTTLRMKEWKDEGSSGSCIEAKLIFLFKFYSELRVCLCSVMFNDWPQKLTGFFLMMQLNGRIIRYGYCIIKSVAGFCLMKQVYGRIFYSSCKSMAVFLLHHAILYGRIFPHETSLWQDFFSMMQVYGSIKRHDYSALWILWKDYLKLKVGLFGKLSQQEEYFARYKYKTDYSFWYKMI